MRSPAIALTLSVLGATTFGAPEARADDVLSGRDPYQIELAYTSQRFIGTTTIPTSFFDPGSDPFSGIVNFRGGALAADPTCSGDLGLCDVIVGRPGSTNTPTTPSTDTIPIEIVALSLVSGYPITVTYGGASPEQWEVRMKLSSAPSGLGTMTIHHLTPSGGTFDAQLPMRPLFEFTRLSDSAVRSLDAGDPQFGSFFDVFATADVQWRHVSDPSEVAQPSCTSNFTGSYDGDSRWSLWTGGHGQLEMRPAPPTTVGVTPTSPSAFVVFGPRPNPAFDGTAIAFELPSPRIVEVEILDLSGRVVRTLVASREFPAGSHTLPWDGGTASGARAPAGMWFIRVRAGRDLAVRKLALVR